jgi:hypothetical protein
MRDWSDIPSDTFTKSRVSAILLYPGCSQHRRLSPASGSDNFAQLASSFQTNRFLLPIVQCRIPAMSCPKKRSLRYESGRTLCKCLQPMKSFFFPSFSSVTKTQQGFNCDFSPREVHMILCMTSIVKHKSFWTEEVLCQMRVVAKLLCQWCEWQCIIYDFHKGHQNNAA